MANYANMKQGYVQIFADTQKRMEEKATTFDTARDKAREYATAYAKHVVTIKGLADEAGEDFDKLKEQCTKVIPIQQQLKVAEKAKQKDKIKELEKKIADIEKQIFKHSDRWRKTLEAVEEMQPTWKKAEQIKAI